MSRQKGWHHTKETRNKISLTRKARDYSYIQSWNKGLTKETDIRVAEMSKDRIGNNNPMFGKRNYNWKGLTPLNLYIRSCAKYINFRNIIFKRDKYECKGCGDLKGGNLNVHHKYTFSSIINEFLQLHSNYSPIEDLDKLIKLIYDYEPLWDKNNCITLCEMYHKKVHAKREDLLYECEN